MLETVGRLYLLEVLALLNELGVMRCVLPFCILEAMGGRVLFAGGTGDMCKSVCW